MKNPSPFLELTKAQRRGILKTLVLFLTIHLGVSFFPSSTKNHDTSFALDSLLQQKVDSIAVMQAKPKRDTVYPFNPNYFSEFKAYQLGVTMDVVKRIQMYRDDGNYMYSLQVFRKVTRLSDEEVTRIQPYLKFPTRKSYVAQVKKAAPKKKELNSATVADLKSVYGIGDVFANRIINIRTRLGGYLVKDQLDDVWGLSPETKKRIWEHFKIDSIPSVEKRNINEMTIADLSRNPYLSTSLASRIVAMRTQKDSLTSWSDLMEIQEIDSIKTARLSLYLSFNKL